MHYTKNKNAFTLVELIIVITILAVLATISFMSFQSYTLNAKRSAAESTLTNVEKGLQTFQVTTGKYPIPDNSVNITNSGIVIGQQGIVGPTVRSVVGLSDVKENIVYSRNNFGNKYQLFTQVPSNNTPSKTEAFVKGDSLGIFTDSSGNFISGTIDVRLHSGSLVNAVLSNNKTISGTGEVIKTLVSNFMGSKTWKEFDPNCPIDDIVIGNQVWAGCNSTLGNGLEWGQSDSDVLTGNFSLTGATCTQSHSGWVVGGACDAGDTLMSSNANAKVWFPGTNVFGDGTYNTIWGKLYTKNTFLSACPAGWRVASDDDYKQLETFFGCPAGDLNRVKSWGCIGSGWRNNGVNTRKIADALYIPLSGGRNDTGLLYDTRGVFGFLGTSSLNTEFPVVRYFANTQRGIFRSLQPLNQNAVSIRCIKAY